jgi:hypothetical protein
MNSYGGIPGIIMVEKIVVKEAERVIQAEINWKNRK